MGDIRDTLQVWYESPAWPLFAYTVFPTLIGIYARKLYVSLTARRRALPRLPISVPSTGVSGRWCAPASRSAT